MKVPTFALWGVAGLIVHPEGMAGGVTVTLKLEAFTAFLLIRTVAESALPFLIEVPVE